MSIYDLFNKPIDQLLVEDFIQLKQIAEGWYAEYKRACPNPDSAAKSLSAFANSYGGWLFYGVEESDSEDRTAGAFPGVSISDVPKVEQWLQQAARNISPPPYYNHRVFKGPNDLLGLREGYALIAVNIPMGRNSPYVHANGRIYRRVSDASDPTHEKDRHFLDLLWQRGEVAKSAFSKFITKPMKVSESEQDVTYLNLYFFPDPWGDRGITSRLGFKDFASLMAASNLAPILMGFDNVFTTSNGFVARQTQGQNPFFRLLTWQYTSDCSSQITLPLRSIRFGKEGNLDIFLKGYEQREPFLKICISSGINPGILIDLSQMFLVLQGLLAHLNLIMEAEKKELKPFFKARITGAWRRIPFIDLPEFSDFVTQYGIPVIQEDEYYAPFGITPDSCLQLNGSQNLVEEIPRQYDRIFLAATIDAFQILLNIGQALGIPASVFGFPLSEEIKQEEFSVWLRRIQSLGDRAREVAKNRFLPA